MGINCVVAPSSRSSLHPPPPPIASHSKATRFQRVGMVNNSATDTNENSTSLPKPQPTLTEDQVTQPNGNSPYTTVKLDIAKTSSKKRRATNDNPGQERRSKRLKGEGGTISEGAIVDKPEPSAQDTPAASSVGTFVETSKTRGRIAKVKIEGKTPDVKLKETPAKRGPKPRKIKFEGVEEPIMKEIPTRKSILAKAKENAKLEPRWKVVIPNLPASQVNPDLAETPLRPRIWMSNREELLSVLPEMAGTKCFNGLSWDLYETPMLLLDEFNTAFQVIKDDVDHRSFDLVTTRSFVFPLQRKDPDTVLAPKPVEYLAQMEPTMHRFTSEFPEIPSAHVTVRETTPSPTAERPKSPAETLKPQEVSTFNTTRTNFFAPLPTYNTYGANEESIDLRALFSQPSAQHPTTRQSAQAMLDTRPNNFSNAQQNGIIRHSKINTTTPNMSVSSSNSRPTFAPDKVQPLSVTPSIQSTVRGDVPTQYTSEEIEIILSTAKRVLGITAGDVGPEATKPLAIPTQQRFMRAICEAFNPKSVADIGVPSGKRTSLESSCRKDKDITGPDGVKGASKLPVRPPSESALSDPSQNSAFPANVVEMPTSNGLHSRNRIAPHNVGTDLSGDLGVHVKLESTPEGSLPCESNGQYTQTTVPDVQKSLIDREFIPSPLPQEIQTVIDAYLFGKPLTLVSSQWHLSKHWSLLLPKDVGYAMMGYFKVIGIQESRVDVPNPPGLMTPAQNLAGQVKWTFRLQWRPGGEEYIMPKRELQDLEYPWWEPPSENINGKSSSDVLGEKQQKQPSVDPETRKLEPEEDYPTTPRYRQARLSHPEYQYRHDHYRELYECVLPSFLLAPFGPLVMDTALSRGWYCEGCGKVNYQAMLRHRQCSSLHCKDKTPTAAPYAIDLFFIRDPQDRLPISFPYNLVPKTVRTNTKTYEGGIKTVSYTYKYSGKPQIAHIFTGNYTPLQVDATTLLKKIQLQVALKRPFNDNSPYFSYLAKRTKGSDMSNDSPWENVPECINTAKSLIATRVRQFSDVEDARISITQMKLLAWVSSGTRKGPEILRATNKCILLWCFGCDVQLTLAPQSMKCSSENENILIKEQETDTNADTNRPDELTTKGGQVVDSKNKTAKKSEKPIVLYLVHGDCVVLDGDDFEYSIKRDGTSFLLIASCLKLAKDI